MAPKRILLVETDDFYVDVIETFVKLFLQLQVVSTRDVSGAFATVQTELPDLILLDLECTGDRALDLAEKIRDSYDVKHIPILSISHDESKRDVALGRGSSAFLAKPFKVRELESVITKLIDRG